MTPFPTETLSEILSAYDCGALIAAAPFTQGSLHTNLRVETDAGLYAFRYYENRSVPWITFELALLDHLAAAGYPTPAPIRNRDGALSGKHAGKPFALFPCLSGHHVPNPNDAFAPDTGEAAARVIAQLHLLTEGLSLPHQDVREGRDVADCRRAGETAAGRIADPAIRKERLARLDSALAKLDLPATLPRGICHADCNHGNFLFDDNGRARVSGVLDFDMACETYLIYDLANLIYWWACPGGGAPDPVREDTLIWAYEDIRPLSSIEKVLLPDALQMCRLMGSAWSLDEDEISL